MKMKKMICFLLSILLIFALAGCGGKKTDEKQMQRLQVQKQQPGIPGRANLKDGPVMDIIQTKAIIWSRSPGWMTSMTPAGM